MKEKKRTVYLWILLVFIWINSGSSVQVIYASELQKILCAVGAVLLLWELGKKKTLLLPKSPTGVFLLWLAAVSLICMAMWGEYSQALLYFSNFAVFYISFRITEYVEEELFLEAFLNVIVFFALVSLVGWFFTEEALNAGLGISITKKMGYRSFLIFNIITTSPNRNSGAFWEPGMFQGFLNFALMILAMKKKIEKTDVLRILVLVPAILTTYSTTGYFVLICMGCLWGYRRIHRRWRPMANVVLLGALAYFFLLGGVSGLVEQAPAFFPKEILGKIERQNISYTTRVYSIVYDILISLQHPFGIGRLHADQTIAEMALRYGYEVNARTSAFSTAFVYYGWGLGIYYLALWVVGCFRFSQSDPVTFGLVLASMLMILNSEPVFFHIFFTCVLFYWLKKKRGKKEYGCFVAL